MKPHAPAAVFASLAAFINVLGCGGSSNTPADQQPVECGPGTELVAGVCVLADGGHSGSQATDGAVEGVYADVDQSPDGDQPEVEPPDASEGLDGPGPDVEQDAESGSSEQEPCLPEYTLNCTSVWGEMSCSPDADDCGSHVCQQNAYKIDSLPFTMRMPSGWMPPLWCTDCPYTTMFAVLLQINVEPDPNMRVRVRVGAPWEIVVNPLTTLHNAYCDSIDSVSDCVVTDKNTRFYVGIANFEDKATIARNVTIEQVPKGTTCP